MRPRGRDSAAGEETFLCELLHHTRPGIELIIDDWFGQSLVIRFSGGQQTLFGEDLVSLIINLELKNVTSETWSVQNRLQFTKTKVFRQKKKLHFL